MDTASTSTSNVTVNYWDPSSVFPLLAPDLKARLPLRNLHWKSPTRPVRSINSLHVDITPAVVPVNATVSDLAGSEPLSRVQSNDSSSKRSQSLPRSKAASSAPAITKERRHQIPGLRQTPYLKIYFLRCDDNESYRSTGKKNLREWIAQNCTQTTASSGSSGTSSAAAAGDNHDAFEWLIVHVVLPGTAAAAQPRLSGQGSSTPSADGKSKWQITSKSTLLEKLKSDFASSSKKNPSRIVQIRLSHPQPSPPPGAVATPTPLPTPSEKEADFTSLITHLKSLILTSFDARVQQYEDDILARQNQQNIPGWNFCTFFVLKEGLAGAFESVGLTEDAGIIYQELAAAGEGIVKREEDDNEGGTTFLGWSADSVKTLVQEGRKWHWRNGEVTPIEPNFDEEDGEEEKSILDSTKKPYRELILSNNISVFDFISYVFSRQSSLLLRLAKSLPLASSTLSHPATAGSQYSFYDPTASPEELRAAGVPDAVSEAFYMAEVLRTGLDFLRKGAIVLRAELWRAWESLRADAKLNKRRSVQANAEQLAMDKWDLTRQQAYLLINNLVSSFVVTGVLQLLGPTNHPALPHLSSESIMGQGPMDEPPPTPFVIAYPPDSNGQPVPRKMELPPLPPKSKSEVVFSDIPMQEQPPKPGVDDLAAVRGEALNLARAIVVEMAGTRWNWNKRRMQGTKSGKKAGNGMVEISLNGDDEQDISEAPMEEMWTWGVKNKLLRYALDSEKAFLKAYEQMSENALRLFTVAGRLKSTDRILTDLAIVKFHLGDYYNAARYLQRLTPKYTSQEWSYIEVSLLHMYAKCLKEMGKDDEYAAVVIQLLQRQIAEDKLSLRSHSLQEEEEEKDVPLLEMTSGVQLDEIPTLQTLSTTISPLSLSIETFFSHLQITPLPHFPSQHGGWRVQLNWRFLLHQSLAFQGGVLKLAIVSPTTSGTKEVVLESSTDEVVTAKYGKGGMWFSSNTMYAAKYVPTSLTLTVGKITLTHTFPATAGGLSLYPPADAVKLTLHMPKVIYLDKLRSVEVAFDANSAIITHAELKIKSLTAGLRVLTHETELLTSSSLTMDSKSGGPGTLVLNGDVKKGRFRIPYKSEGDLTEFIVRLELIYTSEGEVFTYSVTPGVIVSLPLAVNVQDVFRANELISKFSISTVSYVPLRILSSALQPSTNFTVSSPASFAHDSTLVFPKQPAQFVYKIRKTGLGDAASPLSYILQYRTLDIEITDAVTAAFEGYLKEEGLEGYTRLLLPVLTANLKKLPPVDIDAAALVSAVKLRPWSEYTATWNDCLSAIPSATSRSSVFDCIKSFHEKYAKERIPLLVDGKDEKGEGARSIIIPVDIPRLDTLATVRLALHSTTKMLAVGEPVSATLTIKLSKSWAPPPPPPSSVPIIVTTPPAAEGNEDVESKDVKPSEGNKEEFYYDLHISPTDWLISGKRRAQFYSDREDAEGIHEAEVLMIPLRAGYVGLPGCEVKMLGSAGGVETDYRSAGQIVLVVEERGRTVIRVGGEE